MATPKFTIVSVRVPAFLVTRWFRWSCLAAVLLFIAWRIVPFPGQEQESASPFGGLGNMGRRLPCGHVASGAFLSDTATYSCGYGHRFRPFGSWFIPAP